MFDFLVVSVSELALLELYIKNTDVIIFDEATSALDNQTEADVMQAIEELHEQLTILIIAHRLTTLKNCDMIVELDKGKIKRKGTFKEILGSISI